MNSYEEDRQEFRPRPKHVALVAFGLASFLMADVIQSAVTWAVETTVAWNSGWEIVWIIDIPVLTDPSSAFYVSPPLESLWSHAGAIVAIACLGLAVALIYLWPTETSLASRLFVHITAIVLVLEGAVALPLARTDLLRNEEGMSRLMAIALAGLALVISIAIQRSLLVVLQQFWDLHTATERLGLFAALQLPGIVLLATLFWFNGFPAGTVAAPIVLLALVIATVRFFPRTIYERVTTHRVTRAATLIAILGGACIAGSIWAFGFEMIDRPRHAFTWSAQRGPALQSHAEILREQLRDPESVEEKPVIRWSNP